MSKDSKPNQNGQAFDFFACYRAFINRGWFNVLRPTQTAIWHGYLSRADRHTGIGFVTREDAKMILGHAGLSHFREDRKRLVNLGLLELVAAATVAGIHSRAAEYRVLIPPNPSEVRTSSDTGLVRKRRSNPSGSRTKTRPTLEQKPVRTSDTLLPLSSTPVLPNSNSMAAGADEEDSGEEGKHEDDATLRELRAIGVEGVYLRTLAAREDVRALTPLQLRLLYLDTRKKAKSSPIGMFVKRLNEGDIAPPALTPKSFCELVNTRVVIAVNGIAVKGASIYGGDFCITTEKGSGKADWEKVKIQPLTLSTDVPRGVRTQEESIRELLRKDGDVENDNGFVRATPTPEQLADAADAVKQYDAKQRGMKEGLRL